MFVEKTIAELEVMTAEQLQAYKTAEKTHNEAQTKAVVDAEVKAQVELATKIIKQDLAGEIENQLTDKMKAQLGSETKENLKNLIKDNFSEIKNCIKNGVSKDLFTVKAPIIHRTDNDIMTFDATVDFEVGDNVITEAGIVGIRYPENFILNYIPNSQVAKVDAQYRRIEQVSKQGLLAVTLEGGLKPLVSYDFIQTATDREKAACRIEWSEEFQYDWESLFNEIVRKLETDCVREWQDLILDTVLTVAVPYVSSSLDGTLTNPDNGHAIIAAQDQMQALNYSPNLVLMNPSDWTALSTQQDLEGKPLMLPYVGTNDINGINVVRNNKIPQGTAYVLDTTLFREQHGAFMFRTGQYNDQLIHNLYTLIAEVFFVVNIAQRDVVGVVEVDLEAVKDVLQKP